MQSLPFDFKAFIESITVLYKGSSSLFTSILIAWKVFFAGWPPFWNLAGMDFFMISTSSPAVVNSLLFLDMQILFAIFFANFYL